MSVNQPGISHASSPFTIAAFFDVDNTLVPGTAIEVRFFHYLRRAGVTKWTDAARSLWHLLQHMPPVSLHPLRERKLYLEGKRPETIVSLAEAFIQHEVRPRLSRAAVAQLEEHQRNGHRVVFITGCPEFLIAPLAKFLDVETIFCAQPDLDDTGTYTGHLVLPVPYGEGKRLLVEGFAHEHRLNLKDCYAYGDSPGDADILLSVGHPLVVNPIRGMNRLAARYHWPIVRWE